MVIYLLHSFRANFRVIVVSRRCLQRRRESPQKERHPSGIRGIEQSDLRQGKKKDFLSSFSYLGIFGAGSKTSTRSGVSLRQIGAENLDSASATARADPGRFAASGTRAKNGKKLPKSTTA
jgi:hypothetical protein